MVVFPLPCKPYVKHYLKISFGSPANIRHDSVIGKYFFQLVSDPVDRREAYDLFDYRDEIEIKITQDLLLRKGCILTKTTLRYFNLFVENHFKDKIHIMIDSLVEFQGIHINKAVELVYEQFDMDETIFPHETIRKDYQRYRKRLEGLQH